MKIYFLLFILVVSACSAKQPQDSTLQINDGKMRIRGIAKYNLSVGYGNVYSVKVIEKTFDTETDAISLVLIADKFEKQLLENTQQTFVFEQDRKNVPYRMMPENGFVDEEMTLWKLVAIEK